MQADSGIFFPRVGGSGWPVSRPVPHLALSALFPLHAAGPRPNEYRTGYDPGTEQAGGGDVKLSDRVPRWAAGGLAPVAGKPTG